MTEPQPHTPSSSPRWWPAVICSAAVGLGAIAYSYSMHDQLQAAVRADNAKEAEERGKIAARVDAVQSSVETISGQPKADTDAISAQFADVNSKLAALTDRVAAVEKKPEPAPVVVAPVPAPAPAPAATAPATSTDSAALKLAATSGKPFATELEAWKKLHPKTDASITTPLAAAAQSGIPSEADMNRRLRAALDDAVHTKKIDDVSLIGKINTHLSGLVSIKKAADSGPYAKLRSDVTRDDIDTLTTSVEKLSDEDRKPLEDWLTAAHARRDALSALAKLDSAGGE